MEKLLEVKDLYISFKTYAGEVKAVRGVNFEVNKGEIVAIVGESGCGKSVTSQAIMKILQIPPAVYKSGSIMFEGKDLVKCSEAEMREIRGKDIGMIFQDPMTSLNPTIKVGQQIVEGLIKHQKLNKVEAIKRAIEMLELVGIAQPDKRAKQYPHEFSGGMRQRGMIAIALSCRPKLLIADEPTTALDVTIQAQILELMKDLRKKFDTSIIMITHDLGVVAEMCDRVIVMYAGQEVETGSVDDIFKNPQHPYTKGLLKSVPKMNMNRNEQLVPIVGTPPDLFNPPEGCPFFARCDQAMEVCRKNDPELNIIEKSRLEGFNHCAACWLHHPLARAAAEKY
jgi:oligopeptide transport system ATP-binding protein